MTMRRGFLMFVASLVTGSAMLVMGLALAESGPLSTSDRIVLGALVISTWGLMTASIVVFVVGWLRTRH